MALGSLYLQADTSLVLRTVMAQVTNVLLFQSAMVALVVAFFYLLFQGMVTCHLATIAQYFKTFDMERTFTPLSLAKRRRGDEFDILADTFNAMHERVLAMYQEVLAAQQAAKAGEERLNMALDASGAGIWDVDYDIRRIHLGVRDKDIFGNDASGAPMTFEDWAGRLHPDDLPAVRQKLAAIHRNETETLLAEYRYTSGPGQYRWMHVRGRVTRRGPHGKILRMVGIMMDLTERMLIQQSLNEKERFASTVIESLPGLFVMFDSQMRVVRWNRNFAGLVGLAHENPEAVEILRFIPEVDRARLVAMVRQALARGLVATEEVRITAGGGRAAPLHLHGPPPGCGRRAAPALQRPGHHGAQEGGAGPAKDHQCPGLHPGGHALGHHRLRREGPGDPLEPGRHAPGRGAGGEGPGHAPFPGLFLAGLPVREPGDGRPGR